MPRPRGFPIRPAPAAAASPGGARSRCKGKEPGRPLSATTNTWGLSSAPWARTRSISSSSAPRIDDHAFADDRSLPWDPGLNRQQGEFCLVELPTTMVWARGCCRPGSGPRCRPGRRSQSMTLPFALVPHWRPIHRHIGPTSLQASRASAWKGGAPEKPVRGRPFPRPFSAGEPQPLGVIANAGEGPGNGGLGGAGGPRYFPRFASPERRTRRGNPSAWAGRTGMGSTVFRRN